MCITPMWINGHEVPCHKCWQCKEARVDNIVGRCIAEQRTSGFSCVSTLTYGGDNRLTGEVPMQARFLAYRDIQLYLKKVRLDVPVRYIAAGEYGDAKGRGHWHMVLFSQQPVPKIQYNREMFRDHTYWKHGYTHWMETTYETIRYVCAYVLKNVSSNRERLFGASRKPPLGREYFRRIAVQHVEQGLSPQTMVYYFPEVRKKGGALRPFFLNRKSAGWYLQDFIDAWYAVHDGPSWPQSDIVDLHLDQRAHKLSMRVGDWLEQRRFYMKQIGEKGWLGGEGTNEIPIGILADRMMRSRSSEKLDDKLRTMGNRKGQGYQPESDTLGSSSQNKSSAPGPSGIRSQAAQVASTLKPPGDREHLTRASLREEKRAAR